MEYHIDIDSAREAIEALVAGVESGDTLYCQRESQFEVAKQALVAFKRAGVTLCLQDQDGYVVRQTSSRKRNTQHGPRLTDRQWVVIRALEKVLAHCQKEGVALVGYSDELVALPASLAGTDLASAYAVEVDASGVYQGAERIDSDLLSSLD